jgi:hypothetical protein
LVEGNSIRSTSGLTGCHKTTVLKVLVRYGEACQRFLDEQLRGLTLRHVECDEIWTFYGKKQARLTMEERALRHDVGDVYVWTAQDQDSRLIASHLVGKRTGDSARLFMLDLAGRLVWPTAHASDDHAFAQGTIKPIIQISSDAFAAYPEAVDLAFGRYAKSRQGNGRDGPVSPGRLSQATQRPARQPREA